MITRFIEVKVVLGLVLITGILFAPRFCNGSEITTSPVSVSVDDRVQALQREYTRTAEQVNAGREHLLRLEGALSVLTQMKNDVATSTQTYETKFRDNETTFSQ